MNSEHEKLEKHEKAFKYPLPKKNNNKNTHKQGHTPLYIMNRPMLKKPTSTTDVDQACNVRG